MLFELETDERYEYWDGAKMMMTPSSAEHEYVLGNIAGIIRQYVRQHSLGRVYLSNMAIYFHGDVTRKDFRLADLSFVSTERLDIVQSKGIYGAPDLVVEVISPGKANSDRNRIEKFKLYEQYGVSEYWIVQPYEEEIELYVLEDGKYARAERSRLLDGIVLMREEIFE